MSVILLHLHLLGIGKTMFASFLLPTPLVFSCSFSSKSRFQYSINWYQRIHEDNVLHNKNLQSVVH